MGDDVAAPAPKLKKLPFKPTALRRAAPKPTQTEETKEGGDDDLYLFRRSKEMAPIVAADAERRLKRRQKLREAELDPKRSQLESSGEKRAREVSEDLSHESLASDDMDAEITGLQSPVPPASEALDQPLTQSRVDRTSELVTPPPSKRSRLSSGSSSKKPMSSMELDDPFPDASPTPRPRSHLNPSTPSRAPRMESFSSKAAHIISIESDSDSDDMAPQPSTALPTRTRSTSIVELVDRSSSKPASPPPPPPEEDEYAEYIRRAEEQRAREQALRQSNSDEPRKKEIVDILIVSEIPGARILKLKCYFDKRLGDVRSAWIAHQRKHNVAIPGDQSAEVILTWRRKRVYMTNTLLTLGIRPQGDGRAVADSQGLGGFSENRTKVHMEAWTLDRFQEMERDQEMRRKRDAGDISDEESEPLPEPEVKWQILLKARDHEPVGLTVRPSTTVDTLITGFQSRRKVEGGKQVSLWWDGMRLEEHKTLQDAEIEDRDTIEVHFQ
ncbi:hypothetical protein FZEAL_7031 [Fusarium zealandicum]|uniref:Ubiquitin-like domain-containing protein n=1 Tax=Fusarium zealandicum TaxID=1053134 RepID=A0A8H4XIV6_9HYPO|nr:hypothetical protein FZEAL_7031 [Fusarium zealandicum]